MQLRHLLAFPVLAISASAFADTIDFNLRDSSVQLQYFAPLGRDTLGKSVLHAGLLYADKDNQLADIGIQVKDDVSGAPGLSLGVGLKAVAAKAKGNNPSSGSATAISLGGQVRYSPAPVPSLGIVGQLYVSPNIVTFGDATRYIQFDSRVEYELIPSASAYIGYRKVKFDIKNQDAAVLDSGPHIGVRMSF